MYIREPARHRSAKLTGAFNVNTDSATTGHHKEENYVMRLSTVVQQIFIVGVRLAGNGNHEGLLLILMLSAKSPHLCNAHSARIRSSPLVSGMPNITSGNAKRAQNAPKTFGSRNGYMATCKA